MGDQGFEYCRTHWNSSRTEKVRGKDLPNISMRLRKDSLTVLRGTNHWYTIKIDYAVIWNAKKTYKYLV